MPKLKTFNTGLSAPSTNRLAINLPREQQRAAEEPWRNWYKLKRWLDLRLRVFVRDLYQCQEPDCGRIIGDTSQLVAHHTTPHKGNPVLFWDESRIVTVCKPCHDGPIKQRERKAQGYY